MQRDKKGQFIKGHKGYSYWFGKKRGNPSEKTKKIISKKNKGKKRTLEMRKHYRLSKLGKKNPFWKGGRIKVSSGHILVYKPNHPNRNINDRVYEHRLIMEKKLGRYLKIDEIIHHIDMNPSNNKLSNLFLTTKSENAKIHYSLNLLVIELLKDKIIRFNKRTKKYERR